MRTYNLKNFRGEFFATTNDVADAIRNLKQSGKEIFLDTLLGTKGSENEIAVYDANGVFKSSSYTVGVTTKTNFGGENKFATEAGAKAYIDDAVSAVSSAAISVTGATGNAVTVTGEGTEKTIQLVLDGVTLTQSASGLKSNLTVVKLANATSGYAASYQLQDGAGNALGSTIDIVKDQFLKSGFLVWGTSANLNNGVPENESATKTATAKYPFVKLVLYTNENGVSADDTLTTTLYIPADELFHDYTVEQNASQIQLAISGTNEISASVVAGSIGTTELSTSVVASLGLADTAIQAGDVNRIIYTQAEGTEGQEGYKAEVSVKGALDDLYNQIGAGGSVVLQISNAIGNLDYTDTAVANQYVSSVSETDGVINVTRVALPVVSVTYDSSTKELKVNGTAITTLNPATIGADPDGSANSVKSIFLGKAIEFVDVTVTLDGNNVVDVNGCKSILAEGVVTATIPGKVICIYDADGNQIYPDVNYNKTTNVSTVVADFGSNTVDTTWDVTYSRIITE